MGKKNMVKGKNIYYILVYSAYAIMILSSSLLVNVSTFTFHTFKTFSILLFIIAIFFRKYTIREILNVLLTGLLALTVYYNTHSLSFLYFIIVIISVKNIDLKKISSIDLVVRTLGVSLTIMLCLSGLIENQTMIRTKEGFETIRHSLGYVHPNILFMNTFIIAIDIIVLNYSKLKIKTIFFTVVFLTIFSLITGSRTGMLVFFIFLILIFFKKKNKLIWKSNGLRFVIVYSVPIFTLLSYVLVLGYKKSNSFLFLLDEILSGRIRSMTYFFDTYGLSMFGQMTTRVGTVEAALTGQRAFILDNMYFNLIISYGIIFTIIYLYLYSNLNKNLYYEKNDIAIILIFTLFIYGFTESLPLDVEFNYTILLLGDILKYKNSRKFNY